MLTDFIHNLPYDDKLSKISIQRMKNLVVLNLV